MKKKNLEEIQDQIAICAKRKIKVQKRNKSPKMEEKSKKEIKVQIEKGNKSPNRKGEIKFQIEIGISKLMLKKRGKKVIPKITM